MKIKVARTDGSKGRLRDLVAIKSRCIADDDPVKWVANVLAVPIGTIRTPP